MKPPDIFLQTRPSTCGVACMMMIMHHFLGTRLDSVWEGELRKNLKLKRWDLIPGISLAGYMHRSALDVKVRHQEPEKFWDFIRSWNEDIYEQQLAAYRRVAGAGLRSLPGPITVEEIKAEIKNGRLVILGVELDNGIKHAILLYGQRQGKFSLVDPLVGIRNETEENIMAASDIETGRWFISVKKSNNTT